MPKPSPKKKVAKAPTRARLESLFAVHGNVRSVAAAVSMSHTWVWEQLTSAGETIQALRARLCRISEGDFRADLRATNCVVLRAAKKRGMGKTKYITLLERSGFDQARRDQIVREEWRGLIRNRFERGATRYRRSKRREPSVQDILRLDNTLRMQVMREFGSPDQFARDLKAA